MITVALACRLRWASGAPHPRPARLRLAARPKVKPPAQEPNSERGEANQLKPEVLEDPRHLAHIDDHEKAADYCAQGGKHAKAII